MDAFGIYLQAWRWADTVAPPAKHNPLKAGMVGAVVSGGVVAIFCWLLESSRITVPTTLTMILSFALSYMYLQIANWKNTWAFETEFIALLEQEQQRVTGRHVKPQLSSAYASPAPIGETDPLEAALRLLANAETKRRAER